LTPEVGQLRSKWAEKHKDWTVDQWRKVIWSDEASVARGSGKAREWVFGTPEQKWDRDKITEIRNGKAFRIMVWGAFWGSGMSDLYLLERYWESKKHGYSAASYIQILDHSLTGIWEPGLVFMQDNASIHSAKKKNEALVPGNGYRSDGVALVQPGFESPRKPLGFTKEGSL